MQTSLFPHSSPYKRGAAAFVALATTFGALVSSGRPPLPAYAADGPMPQILEEYAALARHIRSIPNSKLNKGQRQSFESKLDSSRKFYKKGDACKAIKHMDVFLKHAETFRKGNSMDAAEDLFNRGWMLKMNILMSLPEGERCGQDAMIGDPSIQIVQSDNQMFSFDVFFPSPMLTTAIGGGETWTRVHYPTLENMVGEVGQPAMPMWRGLVGIPHGSEVRIEMAAPVLGPSPHMNLVPFQPQAVDQNVPPDADPPVPPPSTFADKPFEKNAQTYNQNTALPPDPCSIHPIGQYRDLLIAQGECATGQYNPVSDTLQTFSSIHVEVAFEGGNGKFLTSRSQSPFESTPQLYTQSVLNHAVLNEHILEIAPLGHCFGEELLILTHPNFREAADELAAWKEEKGIMTSVFNVNDGAGSGPDTNEQIDDFIEDRYDECDTRPSYVLLLGDSEYIPTFYFAELPDNTGTDFPYSNYVQILFDAFFPDFGVGRIPVDTLAQANTVVDKIIAYEKNPPVLNNSFFRNAAIASQFQCCRMNANGTSLNSQPGTDQRAFVETSELVRNELLSEGYTVDRIYTRTTDGGGYCIQKNAEGVCTMTQSAYSGDATPRRYFNGTLLPAALAPASGFPWNGSTANISSAWDTGRFLILHRDHGWPGGWSNPGFGGTNVNNLTNGALQPVVFSVNCASGMFDNETAGGTYDTTMGGLYFAERALRKADGGAIGVIGDTRNSPTWANNALTRGFFDAVWPETVPTHGGSTVHRRLGDILNWGKVYLATQMGAAQTAGSISVDDMGYEYHIWHVIGDPTLEMWTGNPFSLSGIFTMEIHPEKLIVHYAEEGAVLTAFQASGSLLVPIGRAMVKGGIAELPYVEQPLPNRPILLSASKLNAISLLLTPREEPPTEPVELRDESTFGDNARHITFDPHEGRTVGEHVSDQYESAGVKFVDDATTTPIIVNDAMREGTTRSDGQSLFNDADTLDPGSAGVPLTMRFTSPMRRVGMYIGNDATGTTSATLTAYDAGGSVLFSVGRSSFGNDVLAFVGMDAGSSSIARVTLDYGATLLGEEIDDLLFE